jgi:hypothetical protein
MGYKDGYNQHEAGIKQNRLCYLLHVGFLLGLFFGSEDGDDIFFRKVH